MAGKKKALLDRRELWLCAYFGMKNKRADYEAAGDTGMVDSIDRFLEVCQIRLAEIRAQEVMGTWPQLLPAAPVH